MKRIFMAGLCLLMITLLYAQKEVYTLSGYVSDLQSGEKLINANVYDPVTLQGRNNFVQHTLYEVIRGAISFGHIGADLITLASMLRIPVNMHNVDEDKIFRPSAWSAFGEDKEGSDFRACAAYGPLYG